MEERVVCVIKFLFFLVLFFSVFSGHGQSAYDQVQAKLIDMIVDADITDGDQKTKCIEMLQDFKKPDNSEYLNAYIIQSEKKILAKKTCDCLPITLQDFDKNLPKSLKIEKDKFTGNYTIYSRKNPYRVFDAIIVIKGNCAKMLASVELHTSDWCFYDRVSIKVNDRFYSLLIEEPTLRKVVSHDHVIETYRRCMIGVDAEFFSQIQNLKPKDVVRFGCQNETLDRLISPKTIQTLKDIQAFYELITKT